MPQGINPGQYCPQVGPLGTIEGFMFSSVFSGPPETNKRWGVLVNTGAKYALIVVNLRSFLAFQHHRWLQSVNGYVQEGPITLQMGFSPTQEYKLFSLQYQLTYWALISYKVQISITEFHLWVKVIKLVLRGNARCTSKSTACMKNHNCPRI